MKCGCTGVGHENLEKVMFEQILNDGRGKAVSVWGRPTQRY